MGNTSRSYRKVRFQSHFLLFHSQILNKIFFALLFVFSATNVAAVPISHNQAVVLINSQKYLEAIALLEELHERNPHNNKVTYDLITTYSWAGQHTKACSLYDLKETESYPPYVQLSVLNSYRNLQQFDSALYIVDVLLRKAPLANDLLLYKGLLLVDKGQLQSARKILKSSFSKTKNSVEYYRLSAYLYTAEKNWVATLVDYQELHKLQPDNPEPLQEQFSILQHLRAMEAASNILINNEQIFTKADHALLLINQAAKKLRWSDHVAKNFNEVKLFSMQALAMQIKAWELLNNTPSVKESLLKNLLNDLVFTFRTLRQMDDVEGLYQILSEKGEVPDYVKQAAAGASLVRHQPYTAQELYKQVLSKSPNNYQAQSGLFYAYIEAEDFDEAYELIDRLFEKEPVFQGFSGGKYRVPNGRYLDLGVMTIMARYFGDQLEEAWKKIDELVQNAPANNWLLEVRGQVSNAREWYHQARGDYHHAALLKPDSLDAKAGEVSSLIALRKYSQARPFLKNILQQFPDEHVSKLLQKEWNFGRKPRYWNDVTFQNSSGPVLNGDSILASVELLSNPINDNLYVNAGHRYAWSEIIEGEETFKRYALGLNYHFMEWDFLGQVTYNDSTLEEVGGVVKAVWAPDDFWRFTLEGERFSLDTPLRALYHGIRSDALAFSMQYRWSEQRQFSLGIRGADFTDTNKRLGGTAILNQRLIDIPHIDLDGRVETYASVNSRRNTPYYNPEQDFSLKGAFHLDHVYYRHYDHLLAQQIDVGYGFYQQKGYGTDWIGHIRYEQRYKYTPWVEMLVGVEIGRNVYDGDAEPYRLIRFMINGKF
jgi:biofilm PGA synthesis protein PgaA